MYRIILAVALSGFMTADAAEKGRYLSWVDENGQLRNTFVGEAFIEQQRLTRARVQALEQERTRQASASGVLWPGGAAVKESKRRYYTWIDANGNIQNSFYAGSQVGKDTRDDPVLRHGVRSSDYIDADAFETQGFARGDQSNPYYTWMDEQGRMHNSPVPPKGPVQPPSAPEIAFTEGRQIEFERSQPLLPNLDGSDQSDALKALLAGSEKGDALYQELQRLCCEQLPEKLFTELKAEQPRYDELNHFSPHFDFPMGKSYYAGFKLPGSKSVYGLRIRSFANKNVVYPSLLFLDEAKRPTRLVSDAVYKFHPETWSRYAFIEGVVPVRVHQGERYVLVLTTSEDRALQTLDNKPFKRPLQALEVDGEGIQSHQHSEQGSFEVAIVR